MTIRDIAKLANVSPTAVSFALNDKPGISDAKKNEILDIVEKTGFSDKYKKRGVSAKRLIFLKLIKSGVLIEQNADFISKIMDSTQAKCKELGYSLQIDVIRNEFYESIKNLDYRGISGLFVLGTELIPDDYKALSLIPVPYIVIDNAMPNFSCNSITMSNEEMAYKAVETLALNGQKDFGHFMGNFNCNNFFERKIGLMDAVRGFNLNFSKEKEFLLTPTLMQSYTEMKAYIKKKRKIPRIVFADNDVIAIGAMKAMSESGIRIPEDVAVIGFDDVNLAETSNPPLSTVRVECSLIGTMATVMLINEIQQKSPSYSKTKVGGNLIIRTSSGNTVHQ